MAATLEGDGIYYLEEYGFKSEGVYDKKINVNKYS